MLTGRELKDGEFTFEMTDSEGEVVATGTNDAEGNVKMSAITFTTAGEFSYTVAEVKGDDSSVTYDTTPHVAVATVTDNLDGTLSVAWTFDGATDEITVTNVAGNPGLTIVKEVTSTPKNSKGYVKGETITWKVTVTNDGDVDLTDVVVTDYLTDDEWTVDLLAVGESKSFTCSYTVTASDVDEGSVTNTASATGKDSDGNDVETGKVKHTVPTYDPPSPTPTPTPTPDTGDDTPIGPLIALMLFGIFGAVVSLRQLGRNRAGAHSR